MMEISKSLAVVFIDYSTVFDSVSHKFVDTDLKKSGVIFRVIYHSASAFTSVRGPDEKKKVRCDSLSINRGVFQEDMTSSPFFIYHDTRTNYQKT